MVARIAEVVVAVLAAVSGGCDRASAADLTLDHPIGSVARLFLYWADLGKVMRVRVVVVLPKVAALADINLASATVIVSPNDWVNPTALAH